MRVEASSPWSPIPVGVDGSLRFPMPRRGIFDLLTAGTATLPSAWVHHNLSQYVFFAEPQTIEVILGEIRKPGAGSLREQWAVYESPQLRGYGWYAANVVSTLPVPEPTGLQLVGFGTMCFAATLFLYRVTRPKK